MRSRVGRRYVFLLLAAAAVACSRLGGAAPTTEPATAYPPSASGTPVAQPQTPSPTLAQPSPPATTDTPTAEPTPTQELTPTVEPTPTPSDDATYPPIPPAESLLNCDRGLSYSYEDTWDGIEWGETVPDALERFLAYDEDAWLPIEGYQRRDLSEQIVVLEYTIDEEIKTAIVVARDPPRRYEPRKPWVVWSVAACDISELGLEAVFRARFEVWRNLETAWIGIDYQGNWCLPHSARFLELGADFPTYVRDPEDAFYGALKEPYDGDAVLPDDAVDTGYVRGGDALWRAKDGGAMYVVRPEVVEKWPKLRDDWACA